MATERQKLEHLREIEKRAYEQKQDAFYAYKDLIIKTNEAYEKVRQANFKERADALDEFNKLRNKRNSAKERFVQLQDKHRKLRDKYERRKNKCQEAIDAANEALNEFDSQYSGSLRIENTKIIPREDGKLDVFYGGEYKAGDGAGHGHAVIDGEGKVTYLRDAWQRHSKSLIDDTKRRKIMENE